MKNEQHKKKSINISMTAPSEEEYLHQLQEKQWHIDNLRDKKIEELTESNILNHLTKILSYDNDNGTYFTPLTIPTVQLQENIFLFRIRPFDAPMLNKSHVWYPPKEVVTKRGRLNNFNESMLYVTGQIATAIAETRLKVGDSFHLLVYKTTQPLNLVRIGVVEGNQSRYKQAEKLIGQFLLDEFSQYISENENERYQISTLIGKFYFNYHVKTMDGWLYPSVLKSKGENIAIDPTACQQKLEFLFSTEGTLETHTDYTLENLRIINKMETLQHITELIENGEINSFDKTVIRDIERLWGQWKKQ